MGTRRRGEQSQGGTERSPRDGVRSWPPFRRLAQAQAAHAAGDAMVAVALANTLFFAVPIGEARDKVALYLALTMAPFAVLSPLVGPLLDRRPGTYRFAILLAGVGRAVVAVMLTSRTDALTLYPLAFTLLVLSRVHGVSRSALVPDAVPARREPMWGNARLAVISVVGAAAGAGVAVAAVEVVGVDLALWLAAAVFVALALPAVGLPHSTKPADAPRAGRDFTVLLSSRLVAGGLAMASLRGAVGFITFLAAFLVRRAGDDLSALGLVVAAAGIGGFVGSVAAPALRFALRESVLLLVCLAAVAAVGIWAAGPYDTTTLTVVAFVMGLASGAARLAFDSLLQADAPRHVRGRAFARYEMIFQLCWVAGAGAATVVPLRTAGGMRILAVIALTGFALAVHGLLGRNIRRRGVAPEAA